MSKLAWLEIVIVIMTGIGGLCAYLTSIPSVETRYAWLAWTNHLIGFRPYFILATIVGTIGVVTVGVMLVVYKDKQAPFDLFTTQDQTVLERPTLTAFEEEIEESLSKRRRDAKLFFTAGERDMKESRYRDGATNFCKSIEAAPTMAAYLSAAICDYQVSAFINAREAALSGLQLASDKASSAYRMHFLNMLGMVANLTGQPGEAMAYYGQALEVSNQLGEEGMPIAIRNNIAMALVSVGRLEEARSTLEQLQELTRDSLMAASLVLNIGITYREQGLYERALEKFREVHTTYLQLGDKQGEARALGNLGITMVNTVRPQGFVPGTEHPESARLRDAITYMERSVALSREITELRGEAINLANMATAYLYLQQFEAAEQKAKEALAIQEAIGDLRGVTSDLIALAVINRVQGYVDNAMAYLEEAIHLSEEGGYRLEEAQARTELGITYISQGKKQEAREPLETAKDIFQAIGNKRFVETVNGLLSQIGE